MRKAIVNSDLMLRAVMWVCLAATLLSLTPQANAQERESFAVAWNVAPSELVGAPVWVKKHEIIAKARLLPQRMTRLSGPVTGPNGEILIDANTELLVPISRLSIGCTMKPPRPRSAAYTFLFERNRNVCLIDEDNDGKYEKLFQFQETVEGVLIGVRKVPLRLSLIDPARYVQASPISSNSQIYINILRTVEKNRFQACFGDYWLINTFCLKEDQRIENNQFPAEFSFFGARFGVLEADEKGKFLISMTSGFQETPLVLYF